MKYFFIFDIDETLLTTKLTYVNGVDRTPSTFNPYRNKKQICYTLNKEKMKIILKAIIDNGDEIGFITASVLDRKDIQTFFKKEFGITLKKNFLFYNRNIYPNEDKILKLMRIETLTSASTEHIYLIDNLKETIEHAINHGFKGIYVDNNPIDPTQGTVYIEQLQILVRASIELREEKHSENKVNESIQSEPPKTNAFARFFKIKSLKITNPINIMHRWVHNL